jgi:hypothetical protein
MKTLNINIFINNNIDLSNNVNKSPITKHSPFNQPVTTIEPSSSNYSSDEIAMSNVELIINIFLLAKIPSCDDDDDVLALLVNFTR